MADEQTNLTYGSELPNRKAALKAKIGGKITELLLKSAVSNIWYDETTTLTAYLEELQGKVDGLAGDGEGSVAEQIESAISEIEEYIGTIPSEGEGEEATPVAENLIAYIDMKAQAAEDNAIEASEDYTDEKIGELGNKTEASEGVEAVPYATVKEYVDDKVSKVATDANGDMKYTNENGTTVELGGIAKGTTFDNMDIKDIIENMLYPYVAITGGSMTMTVQNSDTNREVGHEITVTNASVTFTKGSKNCTKVEVFDGTTSIGSVEGTALVSPVAVDITDTAVNPTVAATATSGSKSFSAKVTDAQGTTVASGTVTYTFYRPYYVGNVDAIPTTADEITALTKNVSSLGSSVSASTKANKYWVLAYPSGYSKNVKATKGVVDANGFDVTSNLVKQSNITVTCEDGTEVAYKVYAGLKGTADATFTVNLA